MAQHKKTYLLALWAGMFDAVPALRLPFPSIVSMADVTLATEALHATFSSAVVAAHPHQLKRSITIANPFGPPTRIAPPSSLHLD